MSSHFAASATTLDLHPLQRLLGLPAQLRARQPHLAVAAQLCLWALMPVLIALALDTRTVNDINLWIKPAKFLVSFVAYYATLAWVFGYLPRAAQHTRAGRFVIWAALLAGLYEMLWLLLAAALGVPSHFNIGAPGWALAYNLAGAGAVLLIAAILVQGMQVARHGSATLAPAMRSALVLGAVIAFAATLVTAGFLAQGSGHWVGGVHSDAGALSLLGWSRTGGDLRVAHFWALHAQQALPLLGALLVWARLPRAVGLVWLGAAAYVGLIVFTFVQALQGVPFLGFIG